MKKVCIAIAMAFVALGLVQPLYALPIVVGNPYWYEFGFTDVGVEATSGVGTIPSSGGNSVYAPDPAWTFTSALPVKLTVVDAFLEGDVFNVYDSGVWVGATSFVANTENDSGTDNPAVAFTIPALSHGLFHLPAGHHALTMQPSQTVMEGAAFFRIDAVPLPGTVLLFGSGLLGLLGLRRKLFS